MEQRLINKMITQKRVVLNFGQLIAHYSFAWFMLLIPIFTLYDHIKSYVDPGHVIDPERDLTGMSTFLVMVSILSFFIQWRRLKFLEYKMNLTLDDFEEALRRTTQSEDWSIQTHNKQLIQAIRRDEVWGTGEMITIIKLDDKLLINSISNPNERSVSFFGRQNKRNVSIFLSNIFAVKKQVPEKVVIPEILREEWTFKNVVVRLLLYPLCFILIDIGIWLIIDTGLKAFIPAFATIIGASTYLYTDLMIITKRKSSNSKW